jgi:hypothetical protein
VKAGRFAEMEMMYTGGKKGKSGTSTSKYEGKSLVLRQVNCRRIYNKALEFWNLIVTYNAYIIIGTDSWLKRT